MPRAAIGLGSNLGDRSRHVNDAVSALARLGTLVRVSSLYETAPIGGPDQGPYLNAAVVIDTELSPGDLLAQCLEIEQKAGRERRERWGPRTIDLDLLLYGDQSVEGDGLEVPHPRLTQRRFVLDPLLEVWPDAALPDGTPLQSFRSMVADQDVRKQQTFTPDRTTSIVLFLLVVVGALAIWWLGDFLL